MATLVLTICNSLEFHGAAIWRDAGALAGGPPGEIELAFIDLDSQPGGVISTVEQVLVPVIRALI